MSNNSQNHNPDELTEDLFGDLQSSAQTYAQTARDAEGPPVAYLDDGTYWLRIWPEVIERGGKKRAQVIRLVQSHTGVPDLRRLSCLGQGCKLCQMSDDLYKSGYKDAWKLGSREEGIIKAFIYRTTARNEYIKVETPIFLILNKRQVVDFNEFIGSLAPAELARIFKVSGPAPIIKMDIAYKKRTEFTIEIADDSLPELSPEFRRTSEIHVVEDDFPSPEEVTKFAKHCQTLSYNSNNTFNPESGKVGGGNQMFAGMSQRQAPSASDLDDDLPFNNGTVTKAAETVPTNTLQQRIETVDTSSLEKTCPSESAGLKFGEYPDDMRSECIVCPIENDCITKTQG